MKNSVFLNQLESRLNRQFEYAVKYLQNLSDAELLRRPNRNEWSTAECIEHLNTYENYYLPLLNKKILLAEIKQSDLEFNMSWMGNYFNKMIYPGTNTKKYKAHAKHLPIVVSPSMTISNHITQQEKLLELIRASTHIDLTKNAIPISIFKFIKLPVGDVYQFLINHNARHLIQAGKVCKIPFKI